MKIKKKNYMAKIKIILFPFLKEKARMHNYSVLHQGKETDLIVGPRCYSLRCEMMIQWMVLKHTATLESVQIVQNDKKQF